MLELSVCSTEALCVWRSPFSLRLSLVSPLPIFTSFFLFFKNEKVSTQSGCSLNLMLSDCPPFLVPVLHLHPLLFLHFL